MTKTPDKTYQDRLDEMVPRLLHAADRALRCAEKAFERSGPMSKHDDSASAAYIQAGGVALRAAVATFETMKTTVPLSESEPKAIDAYDLFGISPPNTDGRINPGIGGLASVKNGDANFGRPGNWRSDSSNADDLGVQGVDLPSASGTSKSGGDYVMGPYKSDAYNVCAGWIRGATHVDQLGDLLAEAESVGIDGEELERLHDIAAERRRLQLLDGSLPRGGRDGVGDGGGTPPVVKAGTATGPTFGDDLKRASDALATTGDDPRHIRWCKKSYKSWKECTCEAFTGYAAEAMLAPFKSGVPDG